VTAPGTAAAARAKAARLSKLLGADHPDTAAAWRDAYAAGLAERARVIAAKVGPLTPEQVACIAVILAAGPPVEVATHRSEAVHNRPTRPGDQVY